jgi:hypothetical protein
MTDPTTILLPREGSLLLREAKANHGALTMRQSPAVGAYVIDRIEIDTGYTLPVQVPREFRALTWGETNYEGQWVTAQDPKLAALHLLMRRRPRGLVPLDEFRNYFPQVHDPGANLGLVVVRTPDLPSDLEDAGAGEFTGWTIHREGAAPAEFFAEPDSYGVVQLARQWPIARLSTNSVAVVGVGSIGATAALSLARSGVGELHLIDPDRLLWHNLIRHPLGIDQVGRAKVAALKSVVDQETMSMDPALRPRVVSHEIDVVENAEVLFDLLGSVDLVLVCADGIAPRRVASHLARIRRKPAVLACVLADGGIGELIRLRPLPRFGCLSCMRAALAADGAMDAEADQELAYGTGFIHKPMTAHPSDLQLMGSLAAKLAMATILESLHSDRHERLPGDHAIVGLRPPGNLAPPFDVTYAGEIRWSELPPPRSNCATCSRP